jgi:hypothetical protein
LADLTRSGSEAAREFRAASFPPEHVDVLAQLEQPSVTARHEYVEIAAGGDHNTGLIAAGDEDEVGSDLGAVALQRDGAVALQRDGAVGRQMQAAQFGRLILRDERTQRRMADDIITEHAKASILREELDPAVEIAAVGAMGSIPQW